MGRSKAYARDAVLAQAMDTFWRKGYHATSLSDLTASTGLNRRSLYAEFGSKGGLFHEALRLYTDRGSRQAAAFLERPPLGLDNIRDYFRSMSYEPDCLGCLMTITINQKSLVSEQSFQLVRDALDLIRAQLHANLVAAYEKGELATLADCDRLADFLLFTIQGITTMGKYAGDNWQLAQVVATVLAALDAAP